ncbi:hypothetical protein SAMN05444817_10193 [Corynebacterium appendicis CIP 107643]|uniref:Uncharacterized protein n=1 Tax=Corynebacterium appendicis CIP 107643 TaxID=1161099 RepID=A0A1N7IN50_9CORY|nr:hypothetical protein [Corynebacterium appendicis]WJY60149.1 hypothetical protein CAPP_01000 [Corynebacterium appendicis CIP 107643]SIS38505.1 hypothetical protein SAMN05444817_10193 [Corynebacterium appendicis CIP 107643]
MSSSINPDQDPFSGSEPGQQGQYGYDGYGQQGYDQGYGQQGYDQQMGAAPYGHNAPQGGNGNIVFPIPESDGDEGTLSIQRDFKDEKKFFKLK